MSDIVSFEKMITIFKFPIILVESMQQLSNVQNHVINDNQFGFSKDKCSNNVIYTFLDILCSNVNKGTRVSETKEKS